jgi:outer membrane lipoprotein-sorting protein
MKSTTILFLTFMSMFAFGQDAKQIIQKAEEKTRGTTSSYTEMTIITQRPKYTREMSLNSWTKGNDYSLMVLTAPAKDAGTAFLKRNKEVWNWVPSIERSIKMPPSMMSQSWMGTDMSNDDLVRESSNVVDYSHKILGEEELLGRKCWKIELTPLPNAPVVWGKVILYIDQKDFIQLKAEQYDEDEELVNQMISSEIKEMAGILIATKIELIPIDKPGNKTTMVINKIVFNETYDDSFFSVQKMKTIR